MPRMEVKNNLLQCTGILSLLECFKETDSTFDNWFNGRWQALNTDLGAIRTNLKVDSFFHDDRAYSRIRAKNLQQYVAPYKVLDMKDIAQAFAISLE